MSTDYFSEETWGAYRCFQADKKIGISCLALPLVAVSSSRQREPLAFSPIMEEKAFWHVINGGDLQILSRSLSCVISYNENFPEVQILVLLWRPSSYKIIKLHSAVFSVAYVTFPINAQSLPHELQGKNDNYCNVEIGSKGI